MKKLFFALLFVFCASPGFAADDSFRGAGAFYHCLILDIPAASPARFTVFDLDGKERGSWVLAPEPAEKN